MLYSRANMNILFITLHLSLLTTIIDCQEVPTVDSTKGTSPQTTTGSPGKTNVSLSCDNEITGLYINDVKIDLALLPYRSTLDQADNIVFNDTIKKISLECKNYIFSAYMKLSTSNGIATSPSWWCQSGSCDTAKNNSWIIAGLVGDWEHERNLRNFKDYGNHVTDIWLNGYLAEWKLNGRQRTENERICCTNDIPNNTRVSISCDDDITGLYINDVNIDLALLPYRSTLHQADNIVFNDTIKKIVLECINYGYAAYMMLSTSNGIATSPSWLCQPGSCDTAKGDSWMTAGPAGGRVLNPNLRNFSDFGNDVTDIWLFGDQRPFRQTICCTNTISLITRVSISCDDEITGLYINDAAINVNAMLPYRFNMEQANNIVLNVTIKKISLECKNYAGPAYMMLSTSNGIATSPSWRCQSGSCYTAKNDAWTIPGPVQRRSILRDFGYYGNHVTEIWLIGGPVAQTICCTNNISASCPSYECISTTTTTIPTTTTQTTTTTTTELPTTTTELPTTTNETTINQTDATTINTTTINTTIHPVSMVPATTTTTQTTARIPATTTKVPINYCESYRCLNGGSCVDLGNGAMCNCIAGFTGISCETNFDECASKPCSGQDSCTDKVNSYECRGTTTPTVGLGNLDINIKSGATNLQPRGGITSLLSVCAMLRVYYDQ